MTSSSIRQFLSPQVNNFSISARAGFDPKAHGHIEVICIGTKKIHFKTRLYFRLTRFTLPVTLKPAVIAIACSPLKYLYMWTTYRHKYRPTGRNVYFFFTQRDSQIFFSCRQKLFVPLRNLCEVIGSGQIRPFILCQLSNSCQCMMNDYKVGFRRFRISVF
jgi:hypothetical protein